LIFLFWQLLTHLGTISMPLAAGAVVRVRLQRLKVWKQMVSICCQHKELTYTAWTPSTIFLAIPVSPLFG